MTHEGSALYRILALTAVALLVGTVASLAAIAFADTVFWLNNALLISPRMRVQFGGSPYIVLAATLLAPVVGGIIVGLLIQKFSAAKRPLGPPDVIYASQMRLPLPDARSGTVSTIAAAVSIGFGASVGQYGPMVYLGSLIGSAAIKLKLQIPSISAIAMACGVAAAISTAFNAPIAGLVFAHEVILRHYSLRAFAPVTVASATGYVMANVMFDRPPLFLVEFSGVENGYEFLLFALLGIVAALIAKIYMSAILRCSRLAANLPIAAWLRPGAAGLAVGVTALWLPDVIGIGKEALRFATIEGAFTPAELALLVPAKIVLTAVCLGFGFAGGAFSPSLLIGILSGALFWNLLDGFQLFENSGIAVYAVCGMMAVTSPVIGAPLTTILIVFELTRNYDLTVGAMVAVVFSNLVAYRIFGRSLFDVQLAARGIDLSEGRDHARLAAIRVADFATSEFPSALPHECANAALDRCSPGKWNEVYVADSNGKFRGIVYRNQQIVNSDALVSEIMQPADVVFREDTDVRQAMEKFVGFVGIAAPLLSSDDRLIGIVTEADVIRAYLDTVEELRDEENASA
ncbi:MAG: chloride channel protein [Albidovulum sp.]|nr:chloride channel protein [Albidovulum sp.]